MAVNASVGQAISQQTADNFWLAQGLATSTAGAATVNLPLSSVTTESLTTAAAATYSFTLTNSLITATSVVTASVGNGTNSAGSPCITTITPAAGSAVIVIQNIHASAALNGTLKLNVLVVN